MSFFKFRDPERDMRADAARIEAVEKALREEVRKLEQEMEGLGRRLDLARDQAAVLLGNDYVGHLEREPEEEKFLQEAERRMLSAEKRIGDLRTQAACFREIQELLDKLRNDLKAPPA